MSSEFRLRRVAFIFEAIALLILTVGVLGTMLAVAGAVSGNFFLPLRFGLISALAFLIFTLVAFVALYGIAQGLYLLLQARLKTLELIARWRRLKTLERD